MSTINTITEYQAAKRTLQAAAAAYYQPDEHGTSRMDDSEYDLLLHEIETSEQEHPEWVTNTPISQQVAAGVALNGEVTHLEPMLSLDNVFNEDALTGWATRMSKLGSNLTETPFTVEPKMDGLAICLRYRHGQLAQMFTRGDGEKGEDVSYAIPNLTGVPHELLNKATELLEVRGEVIFTREQFQQAQELRLNHVQKPFENARNGVAGAVRGARDRAYLIPVSFVAYDYIIPDVAKTGTHIDSLTMVEQLGFTTTMNVIPENTEHVPSTDSQSTNSVLSSPFCSSSSTPKNLTEIIELVRGFEQIAPTLDYETDGLVIKVNSHQERTRIGLGHKAPRWAVAYKFPPKMAMSILREVTWEVGRTGYVAPRAALEPVRIAGSTVSFATLNNPDDIARKGLMLGDHVNIRKAGEIIPEIVSCIPEMRDGTQEPIVVPQECPNCGTNLDNSQARLRCPSGGACAILPKIAYAVGKAGWDIDGFGTALAKGLIKTGKVRNVADIFDLTETDLTAGGCAPANAPKVIKEITAAKSSPLAKTITALGIRGTGRSMSRRLAKNYGTMDALQSATLADLTALEGVGFVTGELIYNELLELAPIIDRLRAVGVNMEGETRPQTTSKLNSSALSGNAAEETTNVSSSPLAGLTVVVTGSMTTVLAGKTREQVNELIENLGGKPSGSINSKTSVLVVGTGGGSKRKKAEELIAAGGSLRIMSEEEFGKLIT